MPAMRSNLSPPLAKSVCVSRRDRVTTAAPTSFVGISTSSLTKRHLVVGRLLSACSTLRGVHSSSSSSRTGRYLALSVLVDAPHCASRRGRSIVVSGLLLVLGLPCSGSVASSGPVVDPVHHFSVVPRWSAALLADRFRCLAAVCVGVEGSQRDDGPGFLLDQGDAFLGAEQDPVFPWLSLRRMFARLSLGPKPSSSKITSSICELYLCQAAGFIALTSSFSGKTGCRPTKIGHVTVASDIFHASHWEGRCAPEKSNPVDDCGEPDPNWCQHASTNREFPTTSARGEVGGARCTAGHLRRTQSPDR